MNQRSSGIVAGTYLVLFSPRFTLRWVCRHSISRIQCSKPATFAPPSLLTFTFTVFHHISAQTFRTYRHITSRHITFPLSKDYVPTPRSSICIFRGHCFRQSDYIPQTFPACQKSVSVMSNNWMAMSAWVKSDGSSTLNT